MNHPLTDYYRVPQCLIGRYSPVKFSGASGFFSLGSQAICYGQCDSGVSVRVQDAALFDVSNKIRMVGSEILLPFDLVQVIENLRRELYLAKLVPPRERIVTQEWLRKCYYFVRESLPTWIRRYGQRIYFSDWKDRPFPTWPVDLSVDRLHRVILRFSMQASGMH